MKKYLIVLMLLSCSVMGADVSLGSTTMTDVSNQQVAQGTIFIGRWQTTSEGGTLDSINIRGRENFATTHWMRGVVYNDVTDSATTLVAVTDDSVHFTSDNYGEYKANFTDESVSGSTWYWLGIYMENQTGTNPKVCDDVSQGTWRSCLRTGASSAESPLDGGATYYSATIEAPQVEIWYTTAAGESVKFVKVRK